MSLGVLSEVVSERYLEIVFVKGRVLYIAHVEYADSTSDSEIVVVIG